LQLHAKGIGKADWVEFNIKNDEICDRTGNVQVNPGTARLGLDLLRLAQTLSPSPMTRTPIARPEIGVEVTLYCEPMTFEK
jgi:hypothetical protein